MGIVKVVRADITTLHVDAIVNAANPSLGGGGGVDGAIHRAAGRDLAKAAMKFAPCPPGEAAITPGFNLGARYVIHVVGPIWQGGSHGEANVLRRAYENAFRLARAEVAIRSIAFPAISTGVYGYPKGDAARIAVEEMRRAEPDFDSIIACVFDAEALGLYERLLAQRD